MNYHPFGAVSPEDQHGPGILFRDGVSYRWVFRNGKLHCGVWVEEQTYSGYHFLTRVS